MIDVHNKKKRLLAAQEKVHSKNILKENIRTLLKFEDDLLAEGIGYARITRYHYELVKLGEFLKVAFKKASCEDLKGFIREIDNKVYSEWTKNGFRVAVKRFYKWLYKLDDEYPTCVKWVKTSFKRSKKKLPTEILSQEDIKKLVSCAGSVRNKALIITLYESGFRIGELLGITVSDLEFGEFGVKVTVNGKTGSRKVLLVSSLPYLSNWVSNHPVGEGALWVSVGGFRKNKYLGYRSVFKIIQKAGERAGVRKKLNPHQFRHSRASHLACNLTEFQMCQFFGWVLGSDMPATYVHLSGRDLDDSILELHGLKKKGGEKKELGVRTCSRCRAKNSFELEFCNNCRLPLTEKAALQVLNEKEKKKVSLFTSPVLKTMLLEELSKIFPEREKELIARIDGIEELKS